MSHFMKIIQINERYFATIFARMHWKSHTGCDGGL